MTQRNPLPYCLAHLSQADPAWRRYVPGETVVKWNRPIIVACVDGLHARAMQNLNPGDLFCCLPPLDRIVK
jgi:hypothetical protein